MENNYLSVSVSPHLHSPVTTVSLMRDVVIALVPALIYSVWLYGMRALVLTCVSVIAAVGFEYLSRIIMKRKQTINDLSAVVTGILLAFCLPANMPLYMIVVGDFIAIVVAKQFFGGIGMNFVNPALIGRIALSVSFAGHVSRVPELTASATEFATKFLMHGDAISTASPMQHMKGLVTSGQLRTLVYAPLVDWKGALLGLHTGSLGEVSIICLVIGGIYLLWRGVIKWIIPVIYILTTFVLTYLYSGSITYSILAILSGGLVLGAIFMATDYTTSPATDKGKVIFALGCGILTATIRYYGSMPEATAFSIVIMNLFVPYINAISVPTTFGSVKLKKHDKKTAEAK